MREKQMKWPKVIKDHIITSVRIYNEDFEGIPFDGNSGLGKMFNIFGAEHEKSIDELNKELKK